MAASTPPEKGPRNLRREAGRKTPEPAWQVYILRCNDGTLYTGCTSDMTRRLASHARRKVKYTRGRLPVELLYQEAAHGRGAALSREAAIKKLRQAEKLALAARTSQAAPIGASGCDESGASSEPSRAKVATPRTCQRKGGT